MKYTYDYERKFKMSINDDIWQFYLITEEEANELDEKLHDQKDGFRGLTDVENKCVFIQEGHVDKSTIGHELFHVQVDYFNLSSADLDIDSFEEVVAVYLERNLDKFVRIRNKIYKRYKKLEGS